MTLKTTVRGQEYDVEVTHSGQFCTSLDNGNSYLKDNTLAGLRAKLSKMTTKVEVPYTRYVPADWRNRPAEVIDGHFTGVHADGRRLLAREDGRSQQFHGSGETFLERLDAAGKADLERLSQAAQEAKSLLDAFVSLRKLTDPHGRIHEALKAAPDTDTDS